MNRNISSRLIIAGLLITASAAALNAQQRMICNGNEGGPIAVCAGITSVIDAPSLGGLFTMTTQGPSTFTIVSQTSQADLDAGQPMTFILDADSWTGTGFDPVLGNVQWSFNTSLPTPQSSIIANQGGSLVPATGDLYFWVEGSVDATPGVTYRSTQVIHVSNTNLNSYNPHNCETYSLVNGPIDFEDINNPGSIVFTMQQLDVTLAN